MTHLRLSRSRSVSPVQYFLWRDVQSKCLHMKRCGRGAFADAITLLDSPIKTSQLHSTSKASFEFCVSRRDYPRGSRFQIRDWSYSIVGHGAYKRQQHARTLPAAKKKQYRQ